MTDFRNLTADEIRSLEILGNSSENWDIVKVSNDFTPCSLRGSRFEGHVTLASGVRIANSSIRNYVISENTLIENTTMIECRSRSSFGNGTKVATMNECAGRTVKIFDRLTAQIAYVMAIYRHRPQTIATLEAMVDRHVEQMASEVGRIGRNCRITCAKLIREVAIGDNVTIDGTSILQNGTICDNSHVGVDVKAYDFIFAECARVDNGSTIDKCFVGENCIIDKGYTATESLLFANTHLENGEASAIFAGPHTVSHHKSSLLIAGMFSFFNAGSGSNQSNHLFKGGAVHQSVHLRGCKFASGAYIMSPALEGAFTMVIGHHSYHHDTSLLPYSYLIESDNRSRLMPAANLTSCGSVRDIEKWPSRDRRAIKRDVINFEEYNPYITESLIKAVDTLNILAESDPDAPEYTYKKVTIKSTSLHKGIKLYTKAIVAAIGSILSKGSDATDVADGKWLDMAGQYISKREADKILDDIDSGALSTPEDISQRFRNFADRYDDHARSWAIWMLGNIIGHTPSQTDITEAILSGENAHKSLRKMADDDRKRECTMDMAISYGLDSESEEEIKLDYYAVRDLK